jgi:hypothetical protein
VGTTLASEEVGEGVGDDVDVDAEQAYVVTPSAVPHVETPEQVLDVRDEQQVLLQP